MVVNPHQQDQQAALRKLKTGWLSLTLLTLVAGAAGYWLLQVEWQTVFARRWLVFFTAAAVFLLGELWRGLKENRHSEIGSLLPTLGPANLLTLARGLWIAGLAGFLFSPRPSGWLAWAPGGLYFLASFVDLFDGYVARVTGQTTRLGQKLDLSVDGLGVLAASVLVVQYGQAPAWYLLVAAARYLFIAWTWLLRRLGKPVYDLPPSIYRRPLAGIQMGFLVIMVLPVFSPPATSLAALVFAAPFLAGFLRDGLGIAGLLETKSTSASLRFDQLLVWLRLAVGALAVWGLLPRLLAFSDLPATVAYLTLLEGLVVLMLAVGLAGRAAAALGLVLLGLNPLFASLAPAQILLLAGYTAIVFAGTGALSIWKPEDRLLFQRFGEARPASGAPGPASGAANPGGAV